MPLSEIYPEEREAPEEYLSASVRQLEALTALAAAPACDGRALEELFAGLADTITELTDYRTCLVVLFNEDGRTRRIISHSANVPAGYVAQAGAKDADKGTAETENVPFLLNEKTFYLRVKVAKGAMCQFSFSPDNKTFTSVGVPFKAREGKWIGAKVGLFFTLNVKFNDAGTADIDWFRVE